jgi:hypothetical protein
MTILTCGLLLSLILLAQACRRCTIDYYHVVPPEGYAFVPYDSTSTFVLEDSLGNRNTFRVESEPMEFQFIDECAECCINDYAQHRAWVFRGDNPALSITVTLIREGNDTQEYAPYMQITMVQGSRFEMFTEASGCFSRPCEDTLTIHGQLYENVFALGNHSHVHPIDSSRAEFLWYNASHGILRYTTLDGHTWELVP